MLKPTILYHPNVVSVLACILWISASVSMIISNKALFETFRFDFAIATLIWEKLFTILLMYVLETFGYISYNKLKTDVVKIWLPCNVFFIFMLVSGIYAIKFLTIPMITIFKKLSTVMTTYSDGYITGRPVPPLVTISCLLIVLSSVIAGIADLSFNTSGYIIMLINCIFTSVYIIYTKQISDRDPATRDYLDNWTMTYYNSVLSILFLIPLFFLFGEHETLTTELKMRSDDVSFWIFMVWMGVVGCGISACSLWAVKLVSPATYSVVGSLNKIPLAITGIIFFRVKMTSYSIVSLVLALSAGMLYTWAKLRAANAPKQDDKPTEKV